MAKRKKSLQESVSEIIEPVAVEEPTLADNLRANLDEIRTYSGVIGYILRNTTSAAIDIKDPTKIVDYAILSSSALDAVKELSELFNLGDAKYIKVEGKNAKALSTIIGENKVSIFMDKGADTERILRKLHAS